MNYLQAITPNPDITCKPGWCLAYVNQAFGPLPIRYGRAIDAWNGSSTQHSDTDFPVGVWVPVWFSLAMEPAGHVALRAPDGSIFSTSDSYGYTPHHHPDMADLIATYAANNPLTYLGWTEDVEGTPVITPDTVIVPASITPQEDAMTPEQMLELKLFIQQEIERRHVVTRELIQTCGFSYENKVFIQEAVESRAVVTRDVVRAVGETK
jgi:hypothetical protein